MLNTLLRDESIFLIFIPAVFASVAIGGRWPGLLATALATIAAPFAADRAPLSFAVMIGGLIFAVTGIGLSLSGGWFHATRRRATDAMVVIDAQGLIRSFSIAAGAAVLADLRRVNSFNGTVKATEHLRRELRK